MNNCSRWIRWAILASLLLAWECPALFTKDLPKVNQDAAVLKEFTDRLEKYVELSKRVLSGLPKLKGTADPAKIAAFQKRAESAIREARSDAKPGDIFFPAVRAQFLRIIRNEIRRPGGEQIRKAIMDENPGPIDTKVNSVYPDGAPVTTVPPSLLQALPRLPEGLEYRFVNRHLILRDRVAGIIVDFIPEAIP